MRTGATPCSHPGMAATSLSPRLMGVLKASVPLFIDVTGKKLIEETIRTHRGVADAIAARNPTAAHDAMYLHLVYNRNMIAEGAQAKSE